MNLDERQAEVPAAAFMPPAAGPLSPALASWGLTARSYLSAGRLLHAIAAGELLGIVWLLCFVEPHPMRFPGLALLALLALFTQLDARSRYQEHKKARDLLFSRGPHRRIFDSLSRSRCQRDAVLAAATQLDHADACRKHFAGAGYRWYHLLPDFVSHHPAYLLSPTFLRATFFAPTYRSRYRWRVDCPHLSATLAVVGKQLAPADRAAR